MIFEIEILDFLWVNVLQVRVCPLFADCLTLIAVILGPGGVAGCSQGHRLDERATQQTIEQIPHKRQRPQQIAREHFTVRPRSPSPRLQVGLILAKIKQSRVVPVQMRQRLGCQLERLALEQRRA